MVQKFTDDGRFKLPELMVEPYRLWFEALKLAHRVENLAVNRDYYKEWGDVTKINFNDWWPDKWRELFGVSMGVREIVDIDDYSDATGNNSVIVRIPLNQSWSRTKSELKSILPKTILTNKPVGKFFLTNSNRIDIKSIRLNLKAYEYCLEGNNIYQTAEKITQWYDDWKEKERIVSHPGNFYNLGKSLQRGEKPDYTSSDYRSAWRTMNRGKKIVSNVAGGEFLGKY